MDFKWIFNFKMAHFVSSLVMTFREDHFVGVVFLVVALLSFVKVIDSGRFGA
jgi:hypothetical protein